MTPGEVGAGAGRGAGARLGAGMEPPDCALEDGRWVKAPGRRPQPAPEGARTSATGVPLDAVRRRPRPEIGAAARQPIRLAPC